jgi:uncharacterized Zn finger protein (UPF0148 family)
MLGKKCDDCDTIVFIPEGAKNGEIIPCPTCGLEYEYQNGELSQLTLEGEDWGE